MATSVLPRSRAIALRLPILDSYVLGELAGPFALAFAAFFIFWGFQVFFIAADYILNQHAPFFLVMRFVVFRIPTAVPLAFPFASLFAALLAMSRLMGDSEINALRTSGVSLARFALAPICFGLAMFVGAFAIDEYVSPWAVDQSTRAMYQIIYKTAAVPIEPQYFQKDPDTGNTFFASQIAPDHKTMLGVWVYQPGHINSWNRVVYADSAAVDGPNLVLHNAHVINYSNDGASNGYDTDKTLSVGLPLSDTLAQFSSSVNGDQWSTSRKTLQSQVRSMRMQGVSGSSLSTVEVSLANKYSWPFGCLIGVIIALPLALRFGKRGRWVGAALAIVTFLVYVLMSSAAQALGRNGVMNAYFAAWLPNIIIGSLGVGLLALEERGEASRFDFSGITQRIVTLAKRIYRGLRALAARLPHASIVGRVSRAVRTPILDAYVLQEFAAPFAVTFLAFFVFWALNIFFIASDYIINQHAPVWLVLKFVIFRMPQAVPMAFPFGCLFAGLLGLGRLMADNEVAALRTSGVALSRIVFTPVLFGVVMFGLCYALNEFFTPAAVDQSTRAFYQILYRSDTLPVEQNFFRADPHSGTVFYVTQMLPDGKSATGVQIFEQDGSGHLARSYQAARATFAGSTVCLHDARVATFDRDEKHYHNTELRSDYCTTLPLGESVAKFTSNVNSDSYAMSSHALAQQIRGLQDQGIGGATLGALEINLANKLAWPFACVVGILIAVPLVLRFGRRGRTMGIAVGVIAFGFYVLLGMATSAFGRNGAMDPYLAAWLPNGVMGLAGLGLLWLEER